jgi:hypothetical protein
MMVFHDFNLRMEERCDRKEQVAKECKQLNKHGRKKQLKPEVTSQNNSSDLLRVKLVTF